MSKEGHNSTWIGEAELIVFHRALFLSGSTFTVLEVCLGSLGSSLLGDVPLVQVSKGILFDPPSIKV